jgi:TRAP transporter TAXI family solute receptor
MPSAKASHPRAAWLYGGAVVLVLAALLATIAWLGPLPPRHVVMATGAPGSYYEALGRQYQAQLARSGIRLELLNTAGAVENIRLLDDPGSKATIALAQGGITTPEKSPGLESLGTIGYEPFWLFVRSERTGTLIEQLRGMRLAIGPEGSGTHALAMQFLALNGVPADTAHLLPLDAQHAAAAILKGDIEGAAIVGSGDTPTVRQLLASSDVNLASFPRADAYAALYPFLNKLVLPAGVGNLATNRPPQDVSLVSPKASLIVRSDLHPAIQYLLLEAASQIHSQPGIFQRADQFPAPEAIDLPLSHDARQFYRSGPPFLQRYLPFWLAVLASRLLVLLIPLLGVAYPLLRLAPTIYGWSIRRRIFRLYGELKYIEGELDQRAGVGREQLLAQLDRLELRANQLQVPIGFAHFLYQVRSHIQLVRGRLEEKSAEGALPA